MIESQPKHLKLGQTKTEVSRMCFGTYKLGLNTDPVAAIDLLGHAYQRGVTFIDSSDNYPGAELIIGKSLREGVLPRDGVVIATKTGLAMSKYEARDFETRRIQEDTSPERIRRRVEGSLRIMDIEMIDLYQVHVHDPNVEPLAIAEVMNELIDEGKIRHWGISNYNEPALVAEIVSASAEAGLVSPVSLQDGYSMIGRYCQEAIDEARKRGMSIMAFSPLRKGALSERLFAGIPALKEDLASTFPGTEKEAELKRELEMRVRLQELQKFAKKNGANIQQLAIAWLLKQEATIPILGTYRQEDFDDLVQALDWNLDVEAMALIDRVIASALSA